MDDRYYNVEAQSVINSTFGYIADLPIAASVVDCERRIIIAYNTKFGDILKAEQGEVLSLGEFIRMDDSAEELIAGLPSIIWVTSREGRSIPLAVNSGFVEANGKNYLLCTYSIAPASFMTAFGVDRDHVGVSGEVQGYSSSLVRNMFDNLPAFIFISDSRKKKIVYVNNTVRELLGDDVIGMDCMKLFGRDGECCGFCNSKDKKNRIVDIFYNDRWFRISKAANFWLKGLITKLIVGVDITEVKNKEHQLLVDATMDLMTGIYNRQSGIDILKECIDKQAAENIDVFTIVYLDINDLKFVNDSFGHSEGDNYILTVVSFIAGAIRKTDIFARMGGDEFLIIFPTCTYIIVEQIMDMVDKKLEWHNDTSGTVFRYSISYGILEVNDKCSLDLEQIMDAVDAKMYCMKEAYRKERVLPDFVV